MLNIYYNINLKKELFQDASKYLSLENTKNKKNFDDFTLDELKLFRDSLVLAGLKVIGIQDYMMLTLPVWKKTLQNKKNINNNIRHKLYIEYICQVLHLFKYKNFYGIFKIK